MDKRHIPFEILHNILLRIPASSLQRLKYVNKRWFQTISDTDFAEAHLAHQSRLEFGCGFILCMKQFILFMEGTSSSNLNPPRHMNLPGAHGTTWVHGSCKGLVLFNCKDTWTKFVTLHVANPITGDNLTLPQFCKYNGSFFCAGIGCGSCKYNGSFFCAGIGCGSGSEIKVVILVKRDKKVPLVCGVLTLGSSTWREVEAPLPEHLILMPSASPIPAGGALHWGYDHGILTFDLVQEKFHQTCVIFCPYFPRKGSVTLMEWDGCLAVIYEYLYNPFYRIWILRDSEWSKLEIDYAFFNRMGFSSNFDGPSLFTSMRNGEIILFRYYIENKQHLLAYDLHRRVTTNFTQFQSDFFVSYRAEGLSIIRAHVNSMIPCKRTGIRAKGATSLKRLICRFIIRGLLKCLCG